MSKISLVTKPDQITTESERALLKEYAELSIAIHSLELMIGRLSDDTELDTKTRIVAEQLLDELKSDHNEKSRIYNSLYHTKGEYQQQKRIQEGKNDEKNLGGQNN